MTDVYSKGALDGLIRILDEQRGDRLRLGTNEAPEALRGSTQLRLTVLPTSNSMLRALCGAMATAHLGRSPAGGSSHFVYECAGVGRFDVEISGDLSEAGTANVLVVRADSGSKKAAAVVSPTREERTPAASSPVQSGQEHPTSVEPRAVQATPVQATIGKNRFEGSELGNWIARAAEQNASDVHLTEQQPVMLRVFGRLQPFGASVEQLAPYLTPAELSEVNAGRAIDFSTQLDSGVRLRVNAYRAHLGLCFAVRILRLDPPPFGSLGLPKEALLAELPPHGLVLVCGHTGAGKSTTLAALCEHILEREASICITLESPIEYRIGANTPRSLVRQREVGTHVASFATGLRDALREDPDLLLLGEIRDAETAALALTAAETGHLVLTSLHARSAASAIDRLVDLCDALQQAQVRTQLAGCLRLVICQQLLPAQQGSGAVLAAEVLTLNHAAAHLIREGKTEQLPTVIQSGKDSGMLPLERHLAELVRSRRVERSVARAAAGNVGLFDQLSAATK